MSYKTKIERLLNTIADIIAATQAGDLDSLGLAYAARNDAMADFTTEERELVMATLIDIVGAWTVIKMVDE